MAPRHTTARNKKEFSNTDFSNVSDNELETLISSAQNELRVRQQAKRKEVVERIKELAASIGTKVELGGTGRRSGLKGQKVPIKFQNPKDSSQRWSGRGLKPRWLQKLLDEGRSIKEFEV